MSSCSPSSRPSPFRQETPLSHYSAQSSIPHIPHRIFLIPKKCVSSSIYRGLFNKVPEPQSAFTTMWYGDHPLPHGNQGTFGAWRFSLSLECTRTRISSPSEFGPRHPDARLNRQPNHVARTTPNSSEDHLGTLHGQWLRVIVRNQAITLSFPKVLLRVVCWGITLILRFDRF